MTFTNFFFLFKAPGPFCIFRSCFLLHLPGQSKHYVARNFVYFDLLIS